LEGDKQNGEWQNDRQRRTPWNSGQLRSDVSKNSHHLDYSSPSAKDANRAGMLFLEESVAKLLDPAALDADF
jgi:hypothetical protein